MTDLMSNAAVAPHLYHGNINPNIIKTINIANKNLSYVAAPDIISMLNAVYRDKWNFTITELRKDDLFGFDMLFTVVGEMYIENIASKMMTASASFVSKCVKSKGKQQMRDEGKKISEIDPKYIIFDNIDSLFKVATTDCMKKLASWFRIAEIVYGSRGHNLFVNSDPILTDRQKKRLSELNDKLGGSKNLMGLLWKWNPTVRNLTALDSSIADNFIAFLEKEIVSD